MVGALTQFSPFGGTRTGGVNPDLTDRGFTGHKDNDDLGPIYMNARYYVSGIGRFASADTIVPSSTYPQSYNRYSYTYNNPLKFTDPTGHYAESGDDACWNWYDRTVQLCPECRDLGWEQYGTPFQKEKYYTC